MAHSMTGISRVFHVSAAARLPHGLRKGLSYGCVFLAAMVIFLAFASQALAQRGVAISYLADETAALGINAVAAPENAREFKGYVPSFMAFSRLPGNFNGAVWLRITLDASFEKDRAALGVDFGTALPGVTRLFIPQANGAFTVMESPPPNGLFVLPENTLVPETLYARIDGTPGLWFKPFLGPAENSPHPLPLHFILSALFGAGILLLLIQYARKAEEWRLWAAITAGCGIVTAILPPTPIATAAYTPLMAAVMLMPGLILVFFTHTTRHLFDSPRTMPGYDMLLVLLYLVGGAIALLPLAPNFLWTSRCLPFATIALLLLLPVGMVAMARSLRGNSAYFCACLLAILGVAVSAWELTTTDPLQIAGTGGLWGLALAILTLACIAPPKDEAKAEDDVFDHLNRAVSPSFPEDAVSPDDPGFAVNAAPVALAEKTPAANIPPAPMPDPEPIAAPSPEDDFPSLSLFGDALDPAEPPSPPQAEPMGLPIPDSALLPLSEAFTAEKPVLPEATPPSPSLPQEREAAKPPAREAFPADPTLAEPSVSSVSEKKHTVHIVAIADDAPVPDILLPPPAPLLPEQEQAAGTMDGAADGEHEATRAPYRIIVADTASTSRARTAGTFDGTPYTVLECVSPFDAYALYTRRPSAMVIMNADMPEVDIAAAIKDIHADDAAHGRSPAFFVALVGYAAQANRMALAGCLRTVLKRQVETDLLPVVEELLPPPPAAPTPAEQEPETPEIRLNEALSDIPTIPESGIFASVLPPSPPAATGTAAPSMADEAATPVATAIKTVSTPVAGKPAMPRAKTASQPDAPKLALLDMIITDEEETVAPVTAAAPVAEPQNPDAQPKGVRVTVKTAPKAAPMPIPRTVPRTVPNIASKTIPGQNAEKTATPGSRNILTPAATPPVTAKQPQKAAAPKAAIKVSPAGSAPSATPSPISIPLPGEEDSVFKDMLPLIPGLVIELHDAMADAARGKMEKSPILVQEAAKRVAGEAENFGLARLERMARCVERAAAADDIEPMECVLADLENWIERYTEVLRKLHREAQW